MLPLLLLLLACFDFAEQQTQKCRNSTIMKKQEKSCWHVAVVALCLVCCFCRCRRRCRRCLFVSNIFASVSVFIDWRGRCQVEEAAAVSLKRRLRVWNMVLLPAAAAVVVAPAAAACLLPDMTCSRSRKSFCVCHIYELRFSRVLQATSHAMCHLWLLPLLLLLLFNYVQLVCSLSQQMMSLLRVLTGWPTVQR